MLIEEILEKLANHSLTELNILKDSQKKVEVEKIGVEVAKIELEGCPVALVALGNDRLALASQNNSSVKVWHVPEKGKPRLLNTFNHPVYATILAACGENRLAVGCGNESDISIWLLPFGEEPVPLLVCKLACGNLSSLVPLSNNRLLIAGNVSTARILHVPEGKRMLGILHSPKILNELKIVEQFNSSGCAVALGNDRVVFYAGDKNFRIWDVTYGKDPRFITCVGMKSQFFNILTFGNDRLIILDDGIIEVWQALPGNDPKRICVFNSGPSSIWRGVFLENGWMALQAYKRILIWQVDGQNPRLLDTLMGHSDEIKALAALRGNRLASGSNDNTIRIWRVGTPVRVFEAVGLELPKDNPLIERVLQAVLNNKSLKSLSLAGIKIEDPRLLSLIVQILRSHPTLNSVNFEQTELSLETCTAQILAQSAQNPRGPNVITAVLDKSLFDAWQKKKDWEAQQKRLAVEKAKAEAEEKVKAEAEKKRQEELKRQALEKAKAEAKEQKLKQELSEIRNKWSVSTPQQILLSYQVLERDNGEVGSIYFERGSFYLLKATESEVAFQRDTLFENARQDFLKSIKLDPFNGEAAKQLETIPNDLAETSLAAKPRSIKGNVSSGKKALPVRSHVAQRSFPKPQLPPEATETQEIYPIIPLDDIHIDRKIGTGGFGVVFLGKWKLADVAVKQYLAPQLSQAAADEFHHEVSFMSKLNHPHIIRLYGACSEPGKYSLVMELMPEGSLHDVLQSQRELSWEMRYQIARDITSGLLYLHTSGIMHRDLKSHNVLLGHGMRAKLADFGLATLKKEVGSTVSYQAVGTVPWMAPELFDPKPSYTKAADMHSYGYVLWELVTREVPFKDAFPAAIPGIKLQGHVEKIPESFKKTSPKFARLIHWCWEQAPEHRPSIDEAASLLEQEEPSDLGAKAAAKVASPAVSEKKPAISEASYKGASKTQTEYKSQSRSSLVAAIEPSGKMPAVKPKIITSHLKSGLFSRHNFRSYEAEAPAEISGATLQDQTKPNSTGLRQ